MTGVMQQMCKAGIKRAHRFVVLPEWQGLGIGMAFIEKVAAMIKREGFAFRIITTTPQLVPALHRHKDKWQCVFSGRQVSAFKALARKDAKLARTSTSEHRLTAIFVYIGGAADG